MSVTIKDIARILNVSHTTVSRALNDSPEISESTKKRIKEMASQLNYVPNYNAKSLVQNRSFNIGLFFSVINDATSPVFFYETVYGANSVIGENYNLVVKGIDSYKDFSSIDAKRFDGILLMSQSESDILFIYEIIKKGIPLVVLNREVEDSSVFNILSADRKGAYDVVAFLIDNGHRNIAFIEGEKGFHASMERREGYISALIDHNILINKEYIVDGNYTLQSGYDAMKKLLSLEQIPTAVFCSNDAMAVGAMKAISEGGWNIPRDISLVGFDESPISSFVTPALTTVSRSIKDISSEGMKRLLYKINNDNMQSQERKIYIKPNLVIRDSVAKVK